MTTYFTQKPDCIILTIYAKPNAKKTNIVGITEQRLNIAVKAKPVEGEANKEIIRFLSKLLKIPQKQITIVSGIKSRQKKIQIPHDFDTANLP